MTNYKLHNSNAIFTKMQKHGTSIKNAKVCFQRGFYLNLSLTNNF